MQTESGNGEGAVGVRREPSPAPSKKRSQLMVRFLVCSFLMGVSFCFHLDSGFLALLNAGNVEVLADGRSPREQCDLFTGEWIEDPLGPAYTNASCNVIEPSMGCLQNGRPDTLYLYWRWKPHGCDISPFDAEKFMNAMRDKSWAFIGDSILRNHVKSLICLVSKVEEPVEVYHDEGFKSITWYFPSRNFTLTVIWAPYLVQAESSDYTEKASPPFQLHLDVLDKNWTRVYHNFDYVVISGGQWFHKSLIALENGTVVGCSECGAGEGFKELGIGYPYRKALRLAVRFIATSDHKPLVFFRTWTPSHFEYGEWSSGGVCNRTSLYEEGEFGGNPSDNMMRDIEIEEFEKAAAVGSKNGARMKLLDTYHLSLLRPDGHPGPYRHPHPFAKGNKAKVQNDCLHWCMPGPIDHWNDVLMEMLRDEGELYERSNLKDLSKGHTNNESRDPIGSCFDHH